MKCNSCKSELSIEEKNCILVNGITIIQCKNCSDYNDIVNGITLNNLFWNND